MGLVFFKINKHKKFNYKPVFYNPDKEENEVNHANEDVNPELESLKIKIKQQWHATKKKKVQKYSSTTIALVIALLFALVYLLLK